MTLKYLLEKEFKQIFRNPFMVRLIIALPIFGILIYPLAANFEIKNINLSIIDHDKSTFSKQLIQKTQSSGYFRVTNISDTYNEAIQQIESDNSDIILEISPNFERSLIKEGKASLMISANAVNGTKGGLGSAYLSQIIFNFNNEVRSTLSNGTMSKNFPNLEVVTKYNFNPKLLYSIFMVPALMVMILAMICGFLPALNIVNEKENGTIEQMNVTPVSRFTLIISKLIPYWIIGYVALTSGMVVAYLAYDLYPAGSLLTIYFFVTLFILAFSGFGLIISNFAQTVAQAMFMIFFFVITLILMSGLYTPVDNMPEWAQLISDVSPLKYIIEVLRRVYLKGSSFSDLHEAFIALMIFTVLFNSLAVFSYKKSN